MTSHPPYPVLQRFAETGVDPGGVGEHVRSCAMCGTVVITFEPGAWSHEVNPEFYIDKQPFRSGGMGSTYTAHDRRTMREVIIKEPAEPTEAATAGAALRMERRLIRERHILALLEHPAIVPVYETGQWPDGTPFFVMRRIHGPTLAETIAATDSFAARIVLLPRFITITEAIAHAHTHGIVHRDLTPDNMMIGEHGDPYVIDWGIATLLTDGADASEQHPILDAVEPVGDGLTLGGVGKEPYASPEQRRGAMPTRQFDVYSLGVTLHHLLSGAVPQRASDYTLEPLPRECPEELVSIVRCATAPKPGARFAHAGELAGELRRYQQGKLVEAHRYTMRARAWRWLMRHRSAVVMVAGCLLAGTALFAAHTWRQESLAAKQRAARAQRAAQRAIAERQAADERVATANNKRDIAMEQWTQATARSKSLTFELARQRRLSSQEVERLNLAIEAEREAARAAMDLKVNAEYARHAAETAAEHARRAEQEALAQARDAEVARAEADARAAAAQVRALEAEKRAWQAEEKIAELLQRAQAAEDRAAELLQRAETAEERNRAVEDGPQPDSPATQTSESGPPPDKPQAPRPYSANDESDNLDDNLPQ